MKVPPLAGVYEIAQMLGVSRQRVDQLSRREDFPRPVAELHRARIWLKAEVEDWQTTRVGGRPREPGTP